MVKTTLSANVEMDSVRETLRAFRELPKDASKALRERSLELSERLAQSASAAGRAEGRQAPLAASTVKPARDRVPAIRVGGTKRVGRNKVPVWKILFGSEFGSDQYRQFGKPHTGRDGTWFFPTVTREAGEIADAWRKAADEVVRKFSDERGVG